MITLGVIFIVLALILEYLANKNAAEGVQVEASYRKTVRVIKAIGFSLIILGLILVLIVFVSSIIVGLSAAS